MQKRAENVQKMVGSVISSGLKGHMESGSTVGLWTFNETLLTGQIPLQHWTETTRQRVALNLVQTLQQQKFEKPARLAVAWAAATNIIAQSEHLTILLITSGSDAPAGTPFDAAIAETFAKNAAEQRKNNMPFLTILRAAKGNVVSFAVNMPPWPLEVPAYPEGLKPVARVTPPPQIETAPPPTPVAKRPDPGILSPTNTIYLNEAIATPEPSTTKTPPAPSATNDPVATAPPSAPSPSAAITNPAAIIAAASTNLPPALAVTAPPPASSDAAGTTPKSRIPIITILVAGICVLLGVMVVFIALLRWSRRSAGESLITRSMHRGDR